MTEDQELLRQYIHEASRRAFEELVRRYQDLVYSSALRQVRDPHLAEDVAQAVFLVLAQKAPGIGPGGVLGGWLFTVTRRAAVRAMQKQRKRNHHERAAAKSDLTTDADVAEWDEISGALDAAISELPDRDRDAVILRYFQDAPFAHIGTQLNLSEEAARKRVSRALERLRGQLSRRGVTVGTMALAAAIGTHAVGSAPATLAATVAAKGSSSAVELAKGVIQMMAWAKIKVAIAAAVVLAFLGGMGAIVTNSLLAQQIAAGAAGGTPAQSNAAQPAADASGAMDSGDVTVMAFDQKSTQCGIKLGGTPGVAEQQDETSLHVIESTSGIYVEIDAKGIRTVRNQRSYERIVFDDRNKDAILCPGQSTQNPKAPSERQIPPLFLNRYSDMLQAGAQDEGPDTIDGKPAEKFTAGTAE